MDLASNEDNLYTNNPAHVSMCHGAINVMIKYKDHRRPLRQILLQYLVTPLSICE